MLCQGTFSSVFRAVFFTQLNCTVWVRMYGGLENTSLVLAHSLGNHQTTITKTFNTCLRHRYKIDCRLSTVPQFAVPTCNTMHYNLHTIKKQGTLSLGHTKSGWWCRWPRVLRCASSSARLLGLRVRVPPGAWMSVYCDSCVLSGRGLCDGPIARSEESYRVWCVWVWPRNPKNDEA